MYLEISPRMAGKTTRMIDEIMKHVERGGKAYVQTNNQSYFRDILNARIMPYMNISADHKNIIYVHNEYQLVEVMRGQPTSKGEFIIPRLFVDEFDVLRERLIKRPTGYYCGTAIRLRTEDDIIMWSLGKREDNLLDLIEMNGGKHETYSPTNAFLNRTIRDIKNLKLGMMKDTWSNEIMGNIYK